MKFPRQCYLCKQNSYFLFNRIFVTSLFFFCIAFFDTQANSREQIRRYVNNGAVVLADESGQRVFDINGTAQYVPASIIKVLTSQIALDLLKPDYRFRTEFYIDARKTLVIRGYGDPFIVSDEIRLMAQGLKKTGIESLNRILIDHSYFTDNIVIPGVSKTNNPYDALNGAFVVNFNTINVRKDGNGKVLPGEKETPLTPLAVRKASGIPAGHKKRFNLSGNPVDCHQYAGELLVVLLEEQGIHIHDPEVGKSTVGGTCKLTYTHYNSRTLREVLRGLLKYSNNFIANQIFLVIGAEKYGAPATLEKGRKVFDEYTSSHLGLGANQLTMVEGSGISRSNKLAADVMISIMERFKSHAELLTTKNGVPVKSGTLKNVSNYVGYIKTPSGLRSFVIMLNQPENYRDTILRLLGQL